MARAWADQTILERMVSAVERVKNRLARATAALEVAGVPYAVVGGNAVAAWVATIDPGGVRNTKDVDILLRRGDLDAAERAFAVAGFLKEGATGETMFLDGKDASPRNAVHFLFANEKILANHPSLYPDVADSVKLEAMKVIPLEALVRITLTSNRISDKMNIRDMLEVGLIDPTWVARLPTELANRLQSLIETPEG